MSYLHLNFGNWINSCDICVAILMQTKVFWKLPGGAFARLSGQGLFHFVRSTQASQVSSEHSVTPSIAAFGIVGVLAFVDSNPCVVVPYCRMCVYPIDDVEHLFMGFFAVCFSLVSITILDPLLWWDLFLISAYIWKIVICQMCRLERVEWLVGHFVPTMSFTQQKVLILVKSIIQIVSLMNFAFCGFFFSSVRLGWIQFHIGLDLIQFELFLWRV